MFFNVDLRSVEVRGPNPGFSGAVAPSHLKQYLKTKFRQILRKNYP